jgi:HK97 family phage major capsid protein
MDRSRWPQSFGSRDGDSLAAAVRKRGEKSSPYNLGHIVQHMAGIPLPTDIRMAMSEGTNSAGGFLVNPELSGQVIDLVRAKSRVFEAGARTVEMRQSTFFMARLDSDCVPVWHGENTADLIANGATFDRVTFTAHTLGSVILVSKELIQDAPNLSEVVTQSLVKAFALEVDRAALLGDGTSNSPIGLAHIAGVTSTTGAAMTDYSDLVASIGRMMANSTFPTAFITSPQVRIKAEGLQDTLHQPLRKPDIMANVPILDTAKVRYSSGSSVYTGDFTILWSV